MLDRQDPPRPGGSGARRLHARRILLLHMTSAICFCTEATSAGPYRNISFSSQGAERAVLERAIFSCADDMFLFFLLLLFLHADFAISATSHYQVVLKIPFSVCAIRDISSTVKVATAT